MDYLLGLLSQVTQSELAVRWAFVATVGLAVASFALALLLALNGALSPRRRRLRRLVQAQPQMATGTSSARIMEALEPISPLAMPKKEAERKSMRDRLKWAGYRSKGALGLYYSLKLVFTILFPLAAFGFTVWYGDISRNNFLTIMLGSAFVGNLLPSIFLGHALKKRQRLLRNGFPDALDLLVVCVESGLGLKAAIARVAEEIGAAHPALADEFVILTSELRAGIETDAALHNLADRNGMDDLRGFAALLSQSIRFGTSVGETLRIYSGEFRDKRMQKAEEAAGKLGVKMLFPMVVCIFPSFFVVAIGPAILSSMKAFSG